MYISGALVMLNQVDLVAGISLRSLFQNVRRWLLITTVPMVSFGTFIRHLQELIG
jgi:hypothetical protein